MIDVVYHVHSRLAALRYRYGVNAKGCIPVRIVEENDLTGTLSVLCEAWMPEDEAKQFVFDNCFTSLSAREYSECVRRKWLPCITLDNQGYFTLQAGSV